MKEKYKIYNLFFIYFILMVAANLIHPITPSIIKRMNLPNFMFGIAYTLMSLTNFIFSYFWSYSCETFGKIKVIFFGSLGYILGQYFFMISDSYFSLIFARIFAGAFAGSFIIATMSFVADYSERNDFKKNISIYSAIGAIATSVGFFLGGQVGSIDLNYSFYLQFILFIIAIFIAIFLLPNKSKKVFSKKEALSKFRVFKNLFTNKFSKYINYALFFILLVYIANVVYDNSFNFYLKDYLKKSPSLNGNIKAICGIVIFIFNSFIVTKLFKKYYLAKILLFNTFIGIFILFISFLVSYNLFLIFNIFFYVTIFFQILLIQTIILQNNPNNSTKLSGIINGFKSIGGIIGGIIAGFSYQINVFIPFCLVVILMFLSCLIYFYKKQ